MRVGVVVRQIDMLNFLAHDDRGESPASKIVDKEV